MTLKAPSTAVSVWLARAIAISYLLSSIFQIYLSDTGARVKRPARPGSLRPGPALALTRTGGPVGPCRHLDAVHRRQRPAASLAGGTPGPGNGGGVPAAAGIA